MPIDPRLSNMSEEEAHLLVASPEVQRLIANAVADNLLRHNAKVTISSSSGHRNPAKLNAGTRDPEQKENFKNPAIVGLLAFGTTTILLSLVNAGIFKLGQVNAAMALPFGGFLQFICGILEYFNNNNFGFVAFTSYGAFWITLALIWLLPTSEHSHVEVGAASSPFVGCYLLLWGLFTCPMLYCTFFKNVGLVLVFSTLAVTFFLLAIGHLAEVQGVTKAGGGLGIVCGLLAMYVSFAEILETNFGREILPLIPLNKKR